MKPSVTFIKKNIVTEGIAARVFESENVSYTYLAIVSKSEAGKRGGPSGQFNLIVGSSLSIVQATGQCEKEKVL